MQVSANKQRPHYRNSPTAEPIPPTNSRISRGKGRSRHGACGDSSTRQRESTPKRHGDFVCSGKLESGRSWGCGKRFTRVDDFAHHVRSSTGRKCIQGLYDEELAKKSLWLDPSIRQSSADSMFLEDDISMKPVAGTGTGDPQVPLIQTSSLSSLFPQFDNFESVHSSPTEADVLSSDFFMDLLGAGSMQYDEDVHMAVPGASYASWWQSYRSAMSATENHNCV
ncbi:DNA-binding transcription factor [Conoideocrella luteorostrata]|uniref:DNA-binding transcription factor n=1 Tax=Conoideocrella luteorostrata TaxID=1105319 RepID=A0AAJ0FQI3_9HYPO|nr:DNA-binding transcription factor [Conoideocrella luteorostrata]